ncbi:hypothetical protein [Adhaeribacter aquaticus]|uniref:hypothetical protein n=1 Tax=Adhaeribacter aquaticus TaxID=299567 RepID=UPI000415F2B0|nr:hypothetical protein [Adhaeribacter aquaticus]
MLKKLFIFFLLLPVLSQAQVSKENKPQGIFSLDSIKIGEPVNFIFYFQHPAEQEIILPDSSFNFAPFEYVTRQFFPTKTKDGQSVDSVVYTLRTFAIAPVQTIALPITILQNQDTLIIQSSPSEIFVKQLVTDNPDPEKLKAEVNLLPVPERFNYAYWLIGLGIGLLLLVGLWLLLGKKIIVRYRLYILKKDHSQFINKFTAQIDQFNKSESLTIIEQTITLWKNYLTDLEGNAINSFTTKEIAAYYNDDEDVTTALRLFDKAIYGNIVSDKSSETIIAFYLLHHFADRRYEYIKEQTRNATNPEIIPQLV